MSFLLSERTNQRDDNFLLIRICSAWLVLFFHSFVLSGNEELVLRHYADDYARLGNLPVDIFFVVSGYLVSSSLYKRGSIWYFVLSRLMRVLPALICSLVFCVFVIGVAYTQLKPMEYFSLYETYRFILVNALLVVKPLQWGLPGVFVDNPFPISVNGSLWTLPYEITMYALLAAAGIVISVLRLLSEKQMGWIWLIAGIVCLIYNAVHSSIEPAPTARFAGLFLTSAACYVFRDKIRITPKIFLPGLALVLFCYFSDGDIVYYRLAYAAFLPYCVLSIAYTKSGFIKHYNRLGDYSYGVYIYAFPIQQALVSSMPGISIIEMIAYASLLSLAIAVFSWHCIEMPFLAKRNRIAKRIGIGPA